MAEDSPHSADHFFTQAAHAGDDADPPEGRPLSPPIYPAVTYTYPDMQDLSGVLHGEQAGYVYSRYGSPTVSALEDAIATLENSAGAIAFSSGMAALHCAFIQADITPRQPIIAARDLYGTTHALLAQMFAMYDKLPVHYVDMSDAAAVKFAIDRYTPRAVFMEMISNPLLKVPDLPQIAGWTHAVGATLIVDGTFATPYLIQALEHGADLVLHSATKYLGGHGDVMAGVIATDARRTSGLRELIKLYGSNLGPFEAWILLRGLKTLGIRMKQHCANALQIAHWLSDQPNVSKVIYPGLPNHPQYRIAQRLFRDNSFGGMLAFELRGAGEQEVFRFMEALKLIRTGTSLGDVGSLLVYPAQSSHYYLSPEERHQQGISAGLVRLSVGIEDAPDIIADLQQAFQVMSK